MIFHRKKGKKGAANSGDEAGSSSLSKRTAKQYAEPTRPVFNVPLPIALDNMPSTDGIPVVALVRHCIDYVTDHGLMVEGIYRISASKNVLDEQEIAINCGEPVSFDDVHEAANLLKRFLRGLPEHILTNRFVQEVERIASQCICVSSDPCRCEVAAQLAEFLSKNLPAPNFYLLAYVFRHAQYVVLNSPHNKMHLIAFGVLLQAILKLSKNEVRIFLLNASSLLLQEGDQPITEIFTSIPFERYTPKSASDANNYANKVSQTVSDPGATLPRNGQQTEPVQVGPLPPVFLEKQLLAVHISLKQDISDEKKNVAQLLTRLRNIQNELSAEQLGSFEQLSIQPSPMPSPNNSAELSTEHDARQLEAKQAQLLTEVTYYRDLAASLRSRLEQCTVLLLNAERNPEKQAKGGKDLGSAPEVEADNGNSLLVTRF